MLVVTGVKVLTQKPQAFPQRKINENASQTPVDCDQSSFLRTGFTSCAAASDSNFEDPETLNPKPPISKSLKPR